MMNQIRVDIKRMICPFYSDFIRLNFNFPFKVNPHSKGEFKVSTALLKPNGLIVKKILFLAKTAFKLT